MINIKHIFGALHKSFFSSLNHLSELFLIVLTLIHSLRHFYLRYWSLMHPDSALILHFLISSSSQASTENFSTSVTAFNWKNNQTKTWRLKPAQLDLTLLGQIYFQIQIESVRRLLALYSLHCFCFGIHCLELFWLLVFNFGSL